MNALVVRSVPYDWRSYLPACPTLGTNVSVEIVPSSDAIADAVRVTSYHRLEETWSNDQTSRAIAFSHDETALAIARDATGTQRYLGDLDVQKAQLDINKVVELARMNIAHLERMATADRQERSMARVTELLGDVSRQTASVLEAGAKVVISYDEGQRGFFNRTKFYSVTVEVAKMP